MIGGPDRSTLVGDPRFFRRTGPHALAAVADAADGEAVPRRLMLHQLAPLATATEQDVTFCINHRRHMRELRATRAAAVIVHPDMLGEVPRTAVPIVAADPLAAWAKVAALFHPLPPLTPGIHASAVVAASARVHPSVEVGPLAVIGECAVLGPRGRVAPLAVIGEGVVIGSDARIGSHVSLSHALVGDRVYLYPGARIGQEGFGFAITAEGLHSVPQLGRVVIEDDVEIGANVTVDRGGLDDTLIGAGTRVDNLVQIAHGVKIGKACVIVAQVGISGSTVLDDHVVLAGQVGVAGHVRIGAGARIGAQAGIMSDVPARAEMLGSPAQPVKAFFREIATIRRWIRTGQPPGPYTARGNPNPDVD